MRMLITAGPTREYFDSVRFLSNASSGKFGYAIAVEALRRGHDVALVSGPVALEAPEGVRTIPVVSAAEMFEAAQAEFERCDAAIMAAAVCDYRPATREPRKHKKDARTLSVDFLPTVDICARLGESKGGRVLVGFALEDHDHREHAEAKLARKGCDAIVLNPVETLGADSARIEILRADVGWSEPVSGTKTRIAVAVVELVESLVQR